MNNLFLQIKLINDFLHILILKQKLKQVERTYIKNKLTVIFD